MTQAHARPGTDPPGSAALDLTSAAGLADALGLDRGEVAEVRVERTGSTGHSLLAFLQVDYAGAAADRLPRRLVLKHRPPPPPGARPAPGYEAEFYARMAPALPSPPVARCVAARAPSAGSPGYFVIEDLRATHTEAPDDEEMDFGPAVDALALIHAARWEADDRSTWGPRSNPTEATIRAAVDRIGAHLPAFFDKAGDALAEDGRRMYERVFASEPRAWLRLADDRAQTLIHGSAHIFNFLFPRRPGGDVFLIDWEGWQADVGARDLAYMMLRRPPERRRRLEEPLLRRYHRRLEALGVRGYGWDELWTDYRLCWIRNLTVPVVKQRKSAQGWPELLEHVVAAFDDLECGELL